jgi:uncharacterized protein (TIGR02453 family)
MHIKDLCRFLFELSENNNRAWFVMNKPRYDILRAEFLELVTELIQDLAKFDTEIKLCEPKKALFRINRDVRFGHDKSPYKTQFSASLVPSGRKKPSEGGGPAYYFQIDANHRLFFAVGEYMPPSDRLQQIRQQILNDEKGFLALLSNKKILKSFGSLREENKLVRPPKGYDAAHPCIEQLKLKSFIVWNEVDLTKTTHAELREILATHFSHAYPLVVWLRNSLVKV